jgi:hypothetical protein
MGHALADTRKTSSVDSACAIRRRMLSQTLPVLQLLTEYNFGWLRIYYRAAYLLVYLQVEARHAEGRADLASANLVFLAVHLLAG